MVDGISLNGPRFSPLPRPVTRDGDAADIPDDRQEEGGGREASVPYQLEVASLYAPGQAGNPFTVQMMMRTIETMERICEQLHEAFSTPEETEEADRELEEQRDQARRELNRIEDRLQLLRGVLRQIPLLDPIQAAQKTAQAAAILQEIGGAITALQSNGMASGFQAELSQLSDQYRNLQESVLV
jgi:hypothetical protein